MNNNAIINLNIDPKIKKEAMKTADEMGLTLSAAINGLLRKFITEKRLEFSTPEIPNAQTRKNIEEAHKIVKTGNYTIYKNYEDFEKYLLA
ncbi:MAG: type II toxin-antitoxin system RelB/DinJ family antitoxin [Minisyncoccia bacterium]